VEILLLEKRSPNLTNRKVVNEEVHHLYSPGGISTLPLTLRTGECNKMLEKLITRIRE